MEEKIDLIWNEDNGLNVRVTAVEDKMAAKQDIEKNDIRLDALTERLETLTEHVGGNKERLETLTEHVAGNTERLDVLTEHVAGNTEQLNQIQTKADKFDPGKA